jgi:hypothetical protein
MKSRRRIYDNWMIYANTNSNSAAALLIEHMGLHETTFKPLSVGPRMVDDDFFGQSLVWGKKMSNAAISIQTRLSVLRALNARFKSSNHTLCRVKRHETQRSCIFRGRLLDHDWPLYKVIQADATLPPLRGCRFRLTDIGTQLPFHIGIWRQAGTSKPSSKHLVLFDRESSFIIFSDWIGMDHLFFPEIIYWSYHTMHVP